LRLTKSLPGADFHDPAQVLERLNATFKTDQHDNRYFTIWYGVFSKTTRQLAYPGGGRPPALLLAGSHPGAAELKPLQSQGPPIGWDLGLPFEANVVGLDPCDRLFIFSDGVFEIEKTGGENWHFDEFLQFMATLPPEVNSMDHLLAYARQLSGSDTLADDFSMLEIVF
jgi:sigma-B regulation protein RsbU (phosphoserine phosphatase)